MSRPVHFDPTRRKWLWHDHLTALVFAQARFLNHGRRQLVQMVPTEHGLFWSVRSDRRPR